MAALKPVLEWKLVISFWSKKGADSVFVSIRLDQILDSVLMFVERFERQENGGEEELDSKCWLVCKSSRSEVSEVWSYFGVFVGSLDMGTVGYWQSGIMMQKTPLFFMLKESNMFSPSKSFQKYVMLWEMCWWKCHVPCLRLCLRRAKCRKRQWNCQQRENNWIPFSHKQNPWSFSVWCAFLESFHHSLTGLFCKPKNQEKTCLAYSGHLSSMQAICSFLSMWTGLGWMLCFCQCTNFCCVATDFVRAKKAIPVVFFFRLLSFVLKE